MNTSASNLHTHNVIFGSQREPLGNTANIPSALAMLGTKQRQRVRKFRLLGTAQKLLSKYNVTSSRSENPHRTRHCHAVKAFDAPNITLKLNKTGSESRSTIGNVQTCGSIWSCPVCAERIATEKGHDIQKALAWAKSENIQPLMIALTAQHDKSMTLDFFKERFKEAWRTFNAHRQWKKFKKEYGIKHAIVNVDITHGDNGWHYHKHLLLFVSSDCDLSPAAVAKIDERLTKLWLSCLELNALEGIGTYALKVSGHQNAGETYLTKLGLTVKADGDLAYEMTSSKTKDSRNIWDLLKDANEGDGHAAKLYVEYVQAMTGDNWINWSKGLHDIVDAFEMPGKIESDEEIITTEDWIIFSDYWWTIVKAAKAYDRLIGMAALYRDIESVRQLLHLIRRELIEENKLPDYYVKFLPQKNTIADIRLHEDWNNEKLSSNSLSSTGKH